MMRYEQWSYGDDSGNQLVKGKTNLFKIEWPAKGNIDRHVDRMEWVIRAAQGKYM